MINKLCNRNIGHIAKLMMVVAVLCTVMTGCMYPQSDTSSGAVVSKEAIRNVQAAIEQYLTTTGVLPIHNSDSKVGRYEKYRVDFGKLKDGGYLENIPNSAFEAGGNFYYLILNEEESPIVKAQSILLTQKVNDLQQKVSDYISAYGEVPLGTEAFPNVYYIDFEKLEIKKPTINSVYTGNISELLVSNDGTVYIDYAPELMQLLQKDSSLVISENLDLRELLVANSDYVPVKSTSYKLVNGEPAAVQ